MNGLLEALGGFFERLGGAFLGTMIAWAVVYGLYHLHNYSAALASLGVAVIWVWFVRRLNGKRLL